MNLSDELHDLAESLIGFGWQTSPEVDWTPDEHRAYHRWATAERARQDAEAAAKGEKIKVVFTRVSYDEQEHERRTAVGAFLRPHRFTLRFTDNNQTLEQYGPGHESGKTYPGVDLSQV